MRELTAKEANTNVEIFILNIIFSNINAYEKFYFY